MFVGIIFDDSIMCTTLWQWESPLSSHYINAESSNSLAPSVPIILCAWQVLQTASSARTELMYVSLCWSAKGSSPEEKVAYELILLQQYSEYLVQIIWMVCAMGGSWSYIAVLWGVGSRICSRQHVAFLCLAFCPRELLIYYHDHRQHGRNLVLFYRIEQISI